MIRMSTCMALCALFLSSYSLAEDDPSGPFEKAISKADNKKNLKRLTETLDRLADEGDCKNFAERLKDFIVPVQFGKKLQKRDFDKQGLNPNAYYYLVRFYIPPSQQGAIRFQSLSHNRLRFDAEINRQFRMFFLDKANASAGIQLSNILEAGEKSDEYGPGEASNPNTSSVLYFFAFSKHTNFDYRDPDGSLNPYNQRAHIAAPVAEFTEKGRKCTIMVKLHISTIPEISKPESVLTLVMSKD